MTKTIIQTLLFLLIAFFLITTIGNLISSNYNQKINSLIQKNDSLLKDNAKLDSLRIIYKEEIDKTTVEINLLNKRDEALILKVSSIDDKVKNLNKKYEKAANHADSFNSNDIARYFSNL
jgi:predicted PurR-regulated permease PerM